MALVAAVNLISLNVWGLHTPGKRHDLFRELKRLQGDINFLQETHLTHTTAVRHFSPSFPNWYYSLSDVSKGKGVAIGFYRGASFTYDYAQIDPRGRFIFLNGSLGNFPCTLANMYAPNNDQVGFIAATLTKLKDFAHGCIVLAGDFNALLEPTIDSSQGMSSLPHRHLAYIRKRLHDAQLMDSWRIMYPRVYARFSPSPHLIKD